MASGCVNGACSATAAVVLVAGGAISAREEGRGALASFPILSVVLLLFESCPTELAAVTVLDRWRVCFDLEFGLLVFSVVFAVPAPLLTPLGCCCGPFRCGVPGEAPPLGGRDSAFPISTRRCRQREYYRKLRRSSLRRKR